MGLRNCPEHGAYVTDTSTDFGDVSCPVCEPRDHLDEAKQAENDDTSRRNPVGLERFTMWPIDAPSDTPALFFETDETDIHGAKLFTIARLEHVEQLAQDAYKLGWTEAMSQENVPEAN